MSRRSARRARQGAQTARRGAAARRTVGPLVAGTIALTAILGPGLTSGATLYAEHELGNLQVSGASIAGPGAGSLRLAAFGDVRPGRLGSRQPVAATWAPPTTLSMPDSYRVYRRVSGEAAWPSDALAAPTTTRFLDRSALNCATYVYRIETAYKALRGPTTVEATITTDGAAPTIGATYIEAAPAGLGRSKGFVKPAAAFYVYAQVDDDCGLTAGSALTADLSEFGGSAATELVAGAFAPGDGSQQFNYMAGPITAAQLPDGARGWTVRAADAAGNHSRARGTTAIVDGTGPSAPVSPQAVSAQTEWYAGTHASIRGSAPYRVFASLEDPAGVAGAFANVGSLSSSGANALLSSGSFETGFGHAWAFRSDVRTSRAWGNGASPTFTITASDRLGNTSSIDGVAHVDNVAPTLETCATVSHDGYLGAGDTTTLTFSEALVPKRAIAGWNGEAAAELGAIVVDGGGSAPDFIAYSHVNLISLHALGLPGWLTEGRDHALAGSSVSITGDRTWTISYGGAGEEVTIPPGAQTTLSASPLLSDAAGNSLAAQEMPCALSAGEPTPQEHVATPEETPPTAPTDVPAEQPVEPVAQDAAPVVEPAAAEPTPEPIAPVAPVEDTAVLPAPEDAAALVQGSSTPDV